jgi:medium-chain acyl-[acyl-carrier-protein] hydrolase
MVNQNQFVVPVSRPNAALRLFCFPHAGGGPAIFYDWSRQFHPAVECVAVQYAGRGMRLRERPATAVDAIVAEIADALAGAQDLPFAFYGHSFGAKIAFETARELRRRGIAGPQHLFAGAALPPHLELPFSPIHHLADNEFIHQVQIRYGGIPAAISREPELLELFLPSLRADFVAYETYLYRPGLPLDLPITALGGTLDGMVTAGMLGQWATHTTAAFALRMFPGDHFFPSTCREALLQELESRLLAGQTERVAS